MESNVSLTEEEVVMLKRLSIGLLTMLDKMGLTMPRCEKCYQKFGYLNKCKCRQ